MMHYKDVENWKWKNFTPKEIACKGTGLIVIHEPSLNCLQALRNELDVPLRINSAYRSPVHNKNVGGAPNSMHLKGQAFDISLSTGINREILKAAAQKVGFTGIGEYNSFIHVDTGRKRYWDLRT